MKKGGREWAALSLKPSGLLVVLPVEEARDVDRFALEPRLSLVGVVLVELRLRSAARDIGHALEQCPAAGCSGRFDLVLVLGRSDRRRTHRRRQDVVGAKQELLVSLFRSC